MPSGVSKAIPAPWGMECDTGTNMNLKGPCSVQVPVGIGRMSASIPASSMRLEASATASGVP